MNWHIQMRYTVIYCKNSKTTNTQHNLTPSHFSFPNIHDQVGGPSFHPRLDYDEAFQRFIEANTDENHQFLDPETYVRYSLFEY